MGPAAVPFVVAGASLLGTTIDIIGGINAASAQEDAALRDAEQKRLQADELMNRQNLNEGILREQGAELESRYIAQNAASGGGGGGLGGALRIQRDIERNIQTTRREADFKATQLRMGADVEQQLSSSLISASYLNAVGKGLSGVGSAGLSYHMLKPKDY